MKFKLVEDYKLFLKNSVKSNGKPYGDRTIQEYCKDLRYFLYRGYTENSLCTSVDTLIEEYSKDGIHYDPDDRGDTVAALKKLKDYLATCKIA